MVIESIAADPRVQGLLRRLAEPFRIVHVTGLWGSSAPMIAALAARSSNRLHVYITAHLEAADDARDDLELFLGKSCELFPAWEALPGEGAAVREIQAERLRVCGRLLQLAPEETPKSQKRGAGGSRARRSKSQADAPNDEKTGKVVVLPIQALMQPVPSEGSLRENTLRVRVGEEIAKQSPDGGPGPDALLEWSLQRGFSRLDLIEAPGDVARRGDIVDLFLPGEANPYRFEFFGDQVESIRRFDITTQRSVETLGHLDLTAIPESAAIESDASAILWDCLPENSVVILDDPPAVEELGRTVANRLANPDRLFSVSQVLEGAGRFPQIQLARFGAAAISGEDVFDFPVASLARFEGEPGRVIAELCEVAANREVHVFCDADGEKQRLNEMIVQHRPEGLATLHLHSGLMHRGFEWIGTKTVLASHHELFQRHRQRRRIRRIHAGRPLETWLDLKAGDFVVHVVHGIAVYRGLSKLRKEGDGPADEFLTLEFAEQAVVHVPCSQIDLVQKYIGIGGRRPQLSTLGGKRWGKMKQQVADSVSDLAESLLRIQAVRTNAEGTAFPQDTVWQREFEAAFPYEETEDQLLVADEIRDDLLRQRPMDRVVCGDVGYGKTELAMRAVFKVVEYGRQVAVLVPTTVLAEQHYETFRERFAEYPFSIGCLSRFRSGTQQKVILDDAKKGRIDVVIGTHRLLSKDVRFANLGLVIIDEEQRFGVEHKERLRSMRETVDVLTLTATPIPRTLHMALMGIRDISSLQTPPVDRRAIATFVRPFSREMIREAVLREMNRDGQVFFVHNFVQSIAALATTVSSIVPEARVVYAHGQMGDNELEEVVHRFARRQADVLVTTTIIESGIDMPSVNTIFINRAERFGLADLHQLRGRVGRSSHRAYCYLLLSPDRPPTDKAAKRLKTIEEFSELGAGFRIAMRDLEIRGAGNLLGKEQSGHIAAVGYEMYCRLLEQTVRKLKKEPDPTPPPIQIDLDVAASIPREYISSERLRIETYRRIAASRTTEDLAQLEKDLADTFGAMPKPVRLLLELSEVRVSARRFGVQSISLRPPDVVFVVESVAAAQPMFSGAAGTVRAPDGKTLHWRPPPAYLEPGTLLVMLRKLVTKAGGATLVAAVEPDEPSGTRRRIRRPV